MHRSSMQALLKQPLNVEAEYINEGGLLIMKILSARVRPDLSPIDR